MTLRHTFFLFFDIYLNIITDLIKTDDGATFGNNCFDVNNRSYIKRRLEVLRKANDVKTKTRGEPTQRWGTL